MAKKQGKQKYTFRDRRGFGVSADIAGNELARIRDESGGALTAALVVDASRPEGAALHPVFEWDDFKAAEGYRQAQARHLIKAVHVVQGENESRPVYVHVGRATTSDVGGYQPVDTVVMRPDLYVRALHELRANLSGATKAVEELEAAAKGVPDVDATNLARISLAVQALQTASAAVSSLH